MLSDKKVSMGESTAVQGVDTDLDRALAFARRLARRVARRVEELPFGFAVFDPELPEVWDLNFVWVDDLSPGDGAPALVHAADRVQGAAGLEHRRIVVAREDSARHLAEGFADLGWERTTHVVMSHRHAPDRRPDVVTREIDTAAQHAFSLAGLRASPEISPALAEQLARIGSRYAQAGARHFGVESESEIVACCDLYLDGDTAQIESVMTLEPHRNRGYARALVLRALDEARAAGATLVFLEAEEDDWPQTLYAKLGFEQVGRVELFTRKPDA